MEKGTVQATDLKKVKDVLEVKLKGEQVLMQSIVKKKSNIILLEGMSLSPDAQLVVIKIGERVRDIEVGDIMLDWRSEGALSFYHKGDEKYIITDQHNISLSNPSSNMLED